MFVFIAIINIACYQQRSRPELGCIKDKYLINTHFVQSDNFYLTYSNELSGSIKCGEFLTI